MARIGQLAAKDQPRTAGALEQGTSVTVSPETMCLIIHTGPAANLASKARGDEALSLLPDQIYPAAEAFMLTQYFPFLDPRHATPAITARLRSLAEDAGRFESDAAFVPELLHSAPIIDDYAPVVHSHGLLLVGDVVGHPQFWSRRIRTSQLWFADPSGQWVRTLSRFYRLGRPGSRDLWPSVTPAGGRIDGYWGADH